MSNAKRNPIYQCMQMNKICRKKLKQKVKDLLVFHQYKTLMKRIGDDRDKGKIHVIMDWMNQYC